jgi:hypothetical protein
MKQKRTLYSLLLTSFILVFAFSFSVAQEVSIQSKSVLRCQPGVLNLTVDNPADISAFEIVFEVTSASGGADFDALTVNWDPGFGVLTNRVIDISGGGGTPWMVRIAGMLIDMGDACLPAGQTVVAQVSFTTNNSCAGVINLAGATYVCPSTPVEASTQFVDCATTTLVPAVVNAGTVTITNSAPSIAAIDDGELYWGHIYYGQAVGSDPDEASCESLTYSILSGPAAMTINASTGYITWTTTGADVCTHTVEIQVEDACGATASTSYEICVMNHPPTVVCPTDVNEIIWGETAAGVVVGNDPDTGPSPLLYSVESFSGPGTVTINPGTGAWTWATMEDNLYLGEFELCVKVTDGANVCDPCSPVNSAVCCLTIKVIPTIRVTIEKTHKTVQGHNETVSIFLDDAIDPPLPMGGFDFLIQYDPSALIFNAATPGQLLLDCGWEYFTYRMGPAGNCGPNACPTGIVRIVAIAETNNGEVHPGCFISPNGQLAVMSFLVTKDLTFECMYVPIRFTWYDCGDNAISDPDGNLLYISRHIYDYDNPTPIEADVAFPSWFGANSSCDIALEDGKPDPIRLLDFWNGGIDIICVEELDARGDVNLNEIGYEIADAVLFANYFVYGLSVFTINLEGQMAATDVNADGMTLSVADLVYMIRVIVGDALPYPKEITEVATSYTHSRTGLVSVSDDVEIGAVYATVRGNTTPELLASNMEMLYNFDGVNTRILVYSLNGNGFTGDVLNVNGELVTLAMATSEGLPVAAKELPTEFSLRQNYPNPFNPMTTVSFDLPKASQVDLKIYNINGQEVASFSGSYQAGTVEIDWDASMHASGVYFYKLVAGNYSDTKKMVLLK